MEKQRVYIGLQQYFQMTKNIRYDCFPKVELFLSLVKLIVFVEELSLKLFSRKILKFENQGRPNH